MTIPIPVPVPVLVTADGREGATLDRDARRAAEPRALTTAVLRLERLLDVGHRGGRGDPAVGDVGEVELAVVALLAVAEADWAPERLDVAQHLGAKRVHAGHPIAVQTPDQVV